MRITYLTGLLILGIAFPPLLLIAGPLAVVLAYRMIRDYHVGTSSLKTLRQERDVLDAGKFFGS